MSLASADAATDTATAKKRPSRQTAACIEHLWNRFHQIRSFTNALCAGLEAEDYVVQSMPDVSPTKWHLAHTTWFLETFILKKFVSGYRPEIPDYAYLFNSYYNAAGDMHRRDLRGLISRPTVQETHRYRVSVDSHIDDLLSDADEKLLDEIEPILVLGIHHEQQHQELLITDIKHVFAQNPLYPVFRGRDAALRRPDSGARRPYQFVDFEETTIAIGHNGDGFAYDNEGPRHQALVPAFSLASRPVTNGDYIEFIEDGGYTRQEFWLSLGWMTVNESASGGWQAPLYWTRRDGAWWHFTLSGFRPVDESELVTHVSYFEADAYASWAGARLPTEFEWERAALDCPVEGNFVEDENFHPGALSVSERDRRLHQMFGDVWEWTRSAYSPYPGYRAAPGALGEYNGKFMCNQYVLRGGSCATSRTHIRPTYRNFFQPEKRWQFTGIRLARDPQ